MKNSLPDWVLHWLALRAFESYLIWYWTTFGKAVYHAACYELLRLFVWYQILLAEMMASAELGGELAPELEQGLESVDIQHLFPTGLNNTVVATFARLNTNALPKTTVAATFARLNTNALPKTTVAATLSQMELIPKTTVATAFEKMAKAPQYEMPRLRCVPPKFRYVPPKTHF